MKPKSVEGPQCIAAARSTPERQPVWDPKAVPRCGAKTRRARGCQAPGGDGPNDTLAARGGRAPGRPRMGGIREKLGGFETCCANGLRARDLGVG